MRKESRSVFIIAGIAIVLFLLWIGRSAILTDPNPATDMKAPDTFQRQITIPPHRRTIKAITPERITIADNQGESQLSNDETIVKVFSEQNGKRAPLSLSSLKVGQNVTVIVVKPGEEILLIVEKI